MCGADAEFPRNAMDGARNVIKRLGMKLVYDKTYPPTTSDYTPVVRAIAATNPDIFLACSYPADTVGLIRASHEVGFKPKIYGGGMVGLQATSIKTQLGPLLNGIVVYDFWLPWAGFASDAGREFVKKYQSKSAEAGVDLLGYYLPPFAYARMEVIEQAVKATGGPTTTSSPSTCARPPTRRWSATWPSTSRANGRRPRSWPCNSRASRATGSSSSRTPRPK
jgi:branched-chain amino acid transport system substrate-binding protein